MTEQIIRRGILQSFDPAGYTANVLIIEATCYVLQAVPIATTIDGTSGITGASCAVLFFDAQNQDDAVIIALYGITPVPTPGRVAFVSGYQQFNAVTINSGITSTSTLTGVGNIPVGALGVLYKVFFTSPTSGASIQMAPHGGGMSNYASYGNLPAAGATINGTGILAVDANGQIDIKANTGNCTVTLYTYGYIF
jgi:hypothetical protein